MHSTAVISRSANRRPQINFIGLISLVSLILAPTTATKHIAAVIKLYGALTGVFSASRRTYRLTGLTGLTRPTAPPTAATHIAAVITLYGALHTTGVFSASRRTYRLTGLTGLTRPTAPTAAAMHTAAVIQHCAAREHLRRAAPRPLSRRFGLQSFFSSEKKQKKNGSISAND